MRANTTGGGGPPGGPPPPPAGGGRRPPPPCASGGTLPPQNSIEKSVPMRRGSVREYSKSRYRLLYKLMLS